MIDSPTARHFQHDSYRHPRVSPWHDVVTCSPCQKWLCQFANFQVLTADLLRQTHGLEEVVRETRLPKSTMTQQIAECVNTWFTNHLERWRPFKSHRMHAEPGLSLGFTGSSAPPANWWAMSSHISVVHGWIMHLGEELSLKTFPCLAEARGGWGK